MEKIDKDKTLISKFNLKSDYDILLMLDGESLSVDEKKYLIEHCQNRIEQMDIDIFLQMLRQTNRDFCEKCNQFLSSKIKSLTVAQTEELFYVNKYYHEVSELAILLVKQDWFQMKKQTEYKAFFTAFELEKMLQMKLISKEKIIDIGLDIINLLTSTNGNTMLFDMVIKNYLFIIEKYNPQSFEKFKKQGYEVINQHILSGREITPNMIIFDCGITKTELKSNVDYFEFYEDEDDKAFAYAHAGTVRINVAAIKDIYQQFENQKIGTQMLFYVIGHEIDHVYCERYKSDVNNDGREELRVFNSSISSALQEAVKREFYVEYHNCFAHEFSANIKGIETLYDKQKYLPSITKKDKEEMNRLLAKILLSSYCLVADDVTEYGYISPVEFSREEFEKVKSNLPGYAYHCLLNNQKELPCELKIIENNLNEMEKCLLGYYNQYIGIINLVVNGNVNSVNLFEDLPVLYNKYQSLVEEEFTSYLTNHKSIRKK